MLDRAGVQLGLDPLPKAPNLVRRFTLRSIFADGETRAQRVLVIVSHHDEGLSENASQIERPIAAKCVGGVGDALAADRRLVEDNRKWLFPGARGLQGRCGRFDIGDGRTGWDQAQIGVANGRSRCGADTAGGVNDRECHAAAAERLQPPLKITGYIDRFDHRFGVGASTLPARKCPLGIGFDQTDGMSGLDGRQREADDKRALAAATLLGRENDLMDLKSFCFLRDVRARLPRYIATCDGEPFSLRTCRPDLEVVAEIAAVRISNLVDDGRT